MSRKCELTGVAVRYGNNVSHSQRKTRRRFEPNIKTVEYKSEITGQKYRLKVVARALRTVEKNGGFDLFILKANSAMMSDKAKKVKNWTAETKKGSISSPIKYYQIPCNPVHQ